MGGVRMCADCRRRKVKCEHSNKDNAERIWVKGGRQDKCLKCEKYGYDCGPPLYAREQSHSKLDSGLQIFRKTSTAGPSMEQQYPTASPTERVNPAPTLTGELAEDKLELKRKLVKIDSRVEISMILQQKIALAVDPDYTVLLLLKIDNLNKTLSLVRLAIPLVDGLAAAGEIDAAENAYNQMLSVYRAMDPSSWYEVKGLLQKLALLSWKTGRDQRAQNFAWEALQCRDTPPRADKSDLELLGHLSESLSRTSNDITEIIQSTVGVAHPQNLTSPIPVLHKMMESGYAGTVSGNIFWTAALPDPTDHASDQHPIAGGIGNILEFIRRLDSKHLIARDSEGRSPLYVAALLGKEAFGVALMARAKEIPGMTHVIMDARDHTGQTILGVSIYQSRSIPFMEALLDHNVDVNPEVPPAILNPLQMASCMGSLEVVQLLLSRGAIVNRTVPGGKTALDMAQEQRHHGIAQLLISVSQGSTTSPHNPLPSPGAIGQDSHWPE